MQSIRFEDEMCLFSCPTLVPSTQLTETERRLMWNLNWFLGHVLQLAVVKNSLSSESFCLSFCLVRFFFLFVCSRDHDVLLWFHLLTTDNRRHAQIQFNQFHSISICVTFRIGLKIWHFFRRFPFWPFHIPFEAKTGTMWSDSQTMCKKTNLVHQWNGMFEFVFILNNFAYNGIGRNFSSRGVVDDTSHFLNLMCTFEIKAVRKCGLAISVVK